MKTLKECWLKKKKWKSALQYEFNQNLYVPQPAFILRNLNWTKSQSPICVTKYCPVLLSKILHFIFKWPFCKIKYFPQPKTPTKQNKTKQNKNHQWKFHLQRIFAVEILFYSTQIFKSPIFWLLEPSSCLHMKDITHWQWDHPIFHISSRSISFLAQNTQDYDSFAQYQRSPAIKPCVTDIAYCPKPEVCWCALHKPLGQTFLLFITWLSILPSICARL